MIVLDTHAWMWWLDDPDLLSGPARGAIAGADEIGVSAMSVWEVGMLAARGRITPVQGVATWVRRALASADVRLVDVDLEIAASGVDLAAHLPDPADALIAATARAFRAPLVTKDRRIQNAPGLQIIW